MPQTKAIRKYVHVATDGTPLKINMPDGRDAWALDCLIAAGKRGCTPITTPGPRWSAYVFKLKNNYGLDIETITEMHGGKYAGKHARYVLRSNVRPLNEAEAA